MARILFRVDGNSKIGAGHIMRCSAIAAEAQRQGHGCAFLSSDGFYREVVANAGIEHFSMDTPYDQMDQEWDKSLPFISQYKPDYMLVDSYFVTPDYLRRMSEHVNLVYMDDVLEFPYPVDRLINYNMFANERDYQDLYKGHKLPELIMGAKYAPLREEFQQLRPGSVNKKAKKVLISTGGSDKERILIRIVNEILKRQESELEYHLLVTRFEPDVETLRAIARRDRRIVIHENVSSVSRLMLMCDMAVSAAGSTLYELCACGVPTITYVMADNQINGARIMSERGIMIDAGDLRTKGDFFRNLIVLVESLGQDYRMRQEMQENGRAFVDGKGVERLVKACFGTMGDKNDII